MQLLQKIERINEKLTLIMPELIAYGVSFLLKRNDNETVPAIHIENGTHEILLPDTSKKEYSFWEIQKIEIPKEKRMIGTAYCSIIWWGRFQIEDSGYLSEYYEKMGNFTSILRDFEADNINIQLEKTFEKYSLFHTEKQLFLFPYMSMKIDFSLKFLDC